MSDDEKQHKVQLATLEALAKLGLYAAKYSGGQNRSRGDLATDVGRIVFEILRRDGII